MKKQLSWIKKLHKSKTIIFSWLLLILGVVEINMHMLQEYLGEYYGITFMCVAIITAILRASTSQRISDK